MHCIGKLDLLTMTKHLIGKFSLFMVCNSNDFVG